MCERKRDRTLHVSSFLCGSAFGDKGSVPRSFHAPAGRPDRVIEERRTPPRRVRWPPKSQRMSVFLLVGHFHVSACHSGLFFFSSCLYLPQTKPRGAGKGERERERESGPFASESVDQCLFCHVIDVWPRFFFPLLTGCESRRKAGRGCGGGGGAGFRQRGQRFWARCSLAF